MKLRFTAEADRSIEVIDTWWRANRDRSPDLFQEELERVTTLLLSAPRMGEVYRSRGRPLTYRVLMKRTRHHVYYTVHDDEGVVEVKLVWGTPLRETPDI